jgi:hypothetical protein
MAYKDYSQLVTYFQGLTATVTELKSVTVGSDEEDLNLQNSRIVYPHLRVDTPEIKFLNDDENMVSRYTFRMYVLSNEPKKTNAEENAVLSSMEKICRKLIRRLWTDADAGLFDLITGEKPADAVRHWSGDNVFGWWWTVVIDLYTDECA